MTEQQLITLGFTKEQEMMSEEGAYYYYTLDIVPHFSLITDASDTIKDGKWSVTLFEVPELLFNDYERLVEFIAVVRKNMQI